MGYIYLLIAITGEVIGTTYLKSSNNFSALIPSTCVVIGYGAAFYFMMLAMKTIPIAITYSIWAGVGIAAITLIGALKYKEVPDLMALIGLFLIILGVIILVFYSKMGVN
jgi:small multidrug resistance pump|tara:strand:+ start:301 stop:630 length:330 start_codon:yes stop_codon:yes gene_type:complete